MGINTDSVDQYWMAEALAQAKLAADKDEVPVGAVLIDEDNQLIASGHNQPITGCDPTAHAEIVVIRQAADKRQNYRLPKTTLYVTLEPCTMCIGALVHARVGRIVYGATEPKTGAVESAFQLLDGSRYNHVPIVLGGVLADACSDVISRFFAVKRALKKAL